MCKRIRKIYWFMRDRGQGKIFILGITLFVVLVLSMFYGIGKSIVRYSIVKQERIASGGNVASSTQATTGTSMQVASGGSVETSIPQKDKSIDISGLDSLVSFMTDESFQLMKQELLNACKGTDVTSMKRLEYQNITGDKVTSYVMMSDGRVFACDYQLQSAKFKVTLTAYDEQGIKKLEKQKEEAAQKRLEKKRKAQKKKLAKSKKKSKKKTKKEVG